MIKLATKNIMGIIEFACKYFGIKVTDLIHKTDYRNTTPRHMVWYYMHNAQGLSNKQIGDLFSRNKRSVMYGISNIKYRISNQRGYADAYNSFIGAYEKETAE